MIEPIRQDVAISEIDQTDTRLKFRININEDAIKAKAESIQKMGLLNPVKLWKQGDHLTLIAGWQRITAVASLGQGQIAAEVYEGITYEDALRINIADNQLRENLSDYETACQMQTLSQREHISAERLASLFGCGVDRVYDLLSVSSMDSTLRTALERGDLTLYQAIIISRFPVSERSEVLERALREGLSVSRLKRELANLKHHPLINKHPRFDAETQVVQHALRVPLSQGFLDRCRAFWEVLGKQGGLPKPMKCEFTLSTIAQRCDPPYVCDHDMEWVILAYGKFPRGEVVDFDWEEVPLKERDGWFFYCERCAQLVFPNIVFHRGTSYDAWKWAEEPTVNELDCNYPLDD
jgi:ParB-like chromosome segregation protein Spo0J